MELSPHNSKTCNSTYQPQRGSNDLNQMTDIWALSIGNCEQVTLIVEYDINIIEDGPHMQCNCRVTWDYGIKNLCHPNNYLG